MAFLELLVPTTLSDCDSSTGWSGGSVNADYKIQGTGCLADKVSNTSTDYYWTDGATRDFTVGGANEGDHVYIWILVATAGLLDTKANSGIAVYINSSTGSGLWNIAGSDTYSGGWILAVVDPNTPPDVETGTFDPSAVTQIGVHFNMAGSTTGNTPNCFWDALRIGKGITFRSNDGSDPPFSLEDIYLWDTGDPVRYYGIVQKIADGVYKINGKISVTSATNIVTSFNDSGSVIIFEGGPVSDSFYGIESSGYGGTYPTDMYLGDSVTNGVTVRAQKDFTIDFRNVLGTAALYGSKFIGHTNLTNKSKILLDGYNDNVIDTCTFKNFTEPIEVGQTYGVGTVKDSTFTDFVIQGDGFTGFDLNDPNRAGAIKWKDGVTFQNLTFNLTSAVPSTTPQSAAFGFSIPSTETATSYSFDGHTFNDDANFYDVSNNTGLAITVNNVNGSNANSSYDWGASSTAFQTAVQLTITGIKDGSDVSVYLGTLANSSSSTLIASQSNVTGGSFTFTHSYPNQQAYIVVQHLSYQYLAIELTLPSTASSIPVQQQVDRVYSNPV